MPKKKQDTPKDTTDNVLVAAAKTLGTAAGKITAAVEATAAKLSSPPKAAKAGKLPKKNKSRLPRRQKKAQKKAADQK